jgi:hypothetical protein
MRSVSAVVFSFCVVFLAGCSGMPGTISNTTNPPTGAVAGTGFRGAVHGGQSPINGAHLYLFAANTTGYGNTNSSISLLNSNVTTQVPAGGQDGSGNYYVTTASDGSFSISGDYTCPSKASQLYLYSIGGNAGSGANSGAGLLAALGACPASGTLSSTLYVVVNEVSTIAAAHSLAAYLADTTHISSSGTTLALTGIANAFATAANLENLGTGVALSTTPGGNGAVPQTKINTLANILAACINSTGPSSTPCTTLFNDATIAGVPTTDTAMAAVSIQRNPQANLTALFALQAGNPPFQPSLSVVPNDFTIAISYTGGGLNGPAGLAIDGSGNVWVSNAGAPSISELASNGTAISTATGFTGGGLTSPFPSQAIPGIAIDTAGNVWIVNAAGGLSEFNSSGTPISGSGGYTGGGLNIPNFLAIDKSNDVWVGNRGDLSLSEFSSTGTPISGSGGYTGGGLSAPSGVAVDVSGNVWAANNGVSGGTEGGNSLSEVSSTGTPISGSSGYTGGGLVNPFTLAIDPSGDIWLTDSDPSTAISEFNSSGAAISGNSGFTGGGLNAPVGIAFDGTGNAFFSNYSGNSITKFDSAGAPISNSNGWLGGLSGPTEIGFDGSGNLWVASSGNNTVTEFVGVGRTPVVTPVVANLVAPYGSHAVNKP